MNLPNRKVGWMLALALIPPLAVALPEDRNQPIQLDASKPWGMREFGVRTPEGHRIMFGQEL